MATTNIKREKKVESINIHLPESQKLEVIRLADLVGLSASEYGYKIIVEHLEKKRAEYKVLRSIFADNGPLSSMSTQGSESAQ